MIAPTQAWVREALLREAPSPAYTERRSLPVPSIAGSPLAKRRNGDRGRRGATFACIIARPMSELPAGEAEPAASLGRAQWQALDRAAATSPSGRREASGAEASDGHGAGRGEPCSASTTARRRTA